MVRLSPRTNDRPLGAPDISVAPLANKANQVKEINVHSVGSLKFIIFPEEHILECIYGLLPNSLEYQCFVN